MSLRFLALPAALVLALAAHAAETSPAPQNPQAISIDEARNRIGTDVAAMDANNDGFIDAAELNAEHELRQAERRQRHAERAQKRFLAMDADADGKVSVAEVVAARSARLEARDRNGDGKIGADESAHRRHAKRDCHDSDKHDAHASGDGGH